ncbi:hypothetical protein CAP48_03810 [Advenella sp. S44]|uniref:hypothetical protein n=1 Tax=Advenella sp. S44 TaxID=1982755 RepID=UPI000C29A1C1|nr:hypothetical protein [Advenella sp. S44]PJX28302.1 hypothetical protein CAP48_03810 [Advenella sp. S44]
MKYSNAAVQQNDARLVSKTLLKLATPRIIMRAVVIIVTIVVWLWVAASILEFGAAQDYAFLNKFNEQLVAFLQSINTYLWWGVVLLGTLIVYFFLSAWYSGSVERAAYKTVPADTASQLIQSLSPEGRDVLGWVWRDRSEPINIGNLKTTKDELDNNRVSKLAQIRDQERLLGAGTVTAADSRIAATLAQTEERDPSLGGSAVQSTSTTEPVLADSHPTVATADVPATAASDTPFVSSSGQPPDAEATTAQTKTGEVATAANRHHIKEQDQATEPVHTVRATPDVVTPTQDEPVLSEDQAQDRPTVSTSEQSQPTIGRSDDTHLRPARDEVKHTIT